MQKTNAALAGLMLLAAPAWATQQAVYSPQPVVVDGNGQDAVWADASWQQMDKHMVGSVPDSADFSGRYKLAWDEQRLYLLVEIVDDVLVDSHPDPKVNYWDDDCLEIFLDEDASGGDHLHSYNAFAYHIALDGNVADFSSKDDGKQVVLLNDHLESKWTRQADAPHKIVWEVSVKLYPDTFSIAQPGEPVTLSADKIIGFMLAYCDNDGSETREHFMGSHDIKPVNGDKNRGNIDASVFGKIKLVK